MKNTLSDIHIKLGLSQENGLFIKNSNYKTDKPIQVLYKGDFSIYRPDFKVEYVLKKLQPHSFFVFNNEPLLLFFDYQELQITKEQLSEKIWNFNRSALTFVNYETELIVYNGFQFDKKSNLLKTLDTIKPFTDLTKIEKYSYWQIVTADLWNDNEFKKNTRVDTKLLENIKTARELLINAKSEDKLTEKNANRIIGRLIFVRYLIDRNVNLDYKGLGKELLTKKNLPHLILQKDNLFDFFEYLLCKFNGNILPLNGERSSIQPRHLVILSDLFAGANISSGQQSMFNIFDFDFIPIEFISNIYETFLGKKQKTDKAFYTPPFLVDYILEQTVKPHVENQYNLNDLSCKTVDFTCGSGIFLCEALRTIINRYISLAKPDKSTSEFKEKIKQLLIDNIFGNDINVEAVEIAKFSLFITLLDYFEDPKDIENFQFPDVSNNFFNKDIFETELYNDNTFVSPLDNIFGKNKQIEPDFIVGNPPWGKTNEGPYIKYCKEREIKENFKLKASNIETFKPLKIEISNKEFAQAFLLRLSDFSSEKTTCQIIVTSKLLYNLQADKFRNYFLNNFLINEVLEISSVRHQIFSNAVGPAAIIKYKYAFGKDTKQNVIDYVSLKPNPYFAIFKSILIEKHDYKEIIQKELIKNDWLWKVLVYGHILDYRFIIRLRDKNEFPVTLGELIEEKENDERPLYARTGIMVGKKTIDISQYVGMYYINTDKNITGDKSHLQRFFIYFDTKKLWDTKKAEGARNDKVFKNPPMLLIKQGFTPDYKIVSSISYIQAIFTRSIYSISSNVSSNIHIETLLGLVNSDLMNYYIILNCLSSINERDRLVNEELDDFPIIFSENIAKKAKHLIKLNRLISIHKKSSFKDNNKIAEYQKQFQQTEIDLNQLIFDLYKLSDTEKDLISYTQEITIPILQAKNKDFSKIRQDSRLFKPYKNVEKPEIEEFITIFKEHFNKLHNGGDRGYFNVKIIQSKNILACEFSVDNEKREDIWQDAESNERALELLASLGFQKISIGLFIQKDIKILNRNSFSVAKPKQYKYWHRAIARLDIVEFMKAMIESQKHLSNGQN